MYLQAISFSYGVSENVFFFTIIFYFKLKRLDQTVWILTPSQSIRSCDASRPATVRQNYWNGRSVPLQYLILGLQCLKNWRNLGIMMLRGRLRASLSSNSDESSQIFCSAPNEPWDTDIHREAVKSKTQTHTDTKEKNNNCIRKHDWGQVSTHGANVQLNAPRSDSR